MSTVLIVGNGFDLNLGLKTSYQDFFESDYFPKVTPSPTMQNILSDVVRPNGFRSFKASVFEYLTAYREITNWCDIESALGDLLKYTPNSQYSGFIITEKSFQELHSKFCEYLNENVASCFDHIKQDSTAYRLAKNVAHMSELSILNFNYTPTLEYIDSWYKNKVDYIHGCLNDKSIILGIEDNLNVPKGYSFLLKTFSPYYRGHNIRQQLQEADHIIIFGHSLSKVDYHYFQDLFVRQTNPKTAVQNQRISIFTKDEKSKRDVLWQIRIMNENKSNYLFDLCKFQIFRTDCDGDRIEAFFHKLTAEKDSLNEVYSFDY